MCLSQAESDPSVNPVMQHGLASTWINWPEPISLPEPVALIITAEACKPILGQKVRLLQVSEVTGVQVQTAQR